MHTQGIYNYTYKEKNQMRAKYPFDSQNSRDYILIIFIFIIHSASLSVNAVYNLQFSVDHKNPDRLSHVSKSVVHGNSTCK